MNKFTHFAGNKDCPKCHGEGSYMYDDMHGQICELCCTHPDGFIQLDSEYWPELIGKEVCKFGCGTQREMYVDRKPIDHPSDRVRHISKEEEKESLVMKPLK